MYCYLTWFHFMCSVGRTSHDNSFHHFALMSCTWHCIWTNSLCEPWLNIQLPKKLTDFEHQEKDIKKNSVRCHFELCGFTFSPARYSTSNLLHQILNPATVSKDPVRQNGYKQAFLDDFNNLITFIICRSSRHYVSVKDFLLHRGLGCHFSDDFHQSRSFPPLCLN